MARQPHHLPPHSRPSECEDEEHYSTSTDDDSDSDSESSHSHDTQNVKPPSPACKKPTSKPTHFKPNAKRPEQQVSKSKKSKSVENVDKVSMIDKSKSVEDVDKRSKSDKSKRVDKSSTSVENVDKGSTSDVNVDKGSKKSQTNHGDDSEIENKKEALFTRLFTEKDEIVLLEGMIHYKQKKGADPNSNMVAFHKFIEGSLSFSVAKKQIVDKISKLKRKFMNNVRK